VLAVRYPGGVAVIALALALVGLGYRIGSLPVQALSFVLAIAGLLLCVHGMHGVRTGGFVLVFLLLAVPPPREALSAVGAGVQQFVATFSVAALNVLGIPVEQQGVLLRLPGLTLEVAEECNGLRFTLILLVFVSVFARVVLTTIPAQLTLMALAIPVAVLANAFRVATTAIGAYAIGPHVASGPIHYYVGKTFWVLAVLVMIGLSLLLRSRIARTVPHERARRPYVAGAA
jgi:exosortase